MAQKLTPKERDWLELIVKGMAPHDAAQRVGLHVHLAQRLFREPHFQRELALATDAQLRRVGRTIGTVLMTAVQSVGRALVESRKDDADFALSATQALLKAYDSEWARNLEHGQSAIGYDGDSANAEDWWERLRLSEPAAPKPNPFARFVPPEPEGN